MVSFPQIAMTDHSCEAIGVQVYLELTIGNSKWPIGGGEFLSSDGPQPGPTSGTCKAIASTNPHMLIDVVW